MLLPWELKILKFTFEKPTSKKIFWDLFPFDYQYCPISLPLNNKVLVSSFCSALNFHSDLSQYWYIVPFWTVRGLNPDGGEAFCTCPDWPWGAPSLLYNG
jgi:hypothetical protein